MRLYLDKEQHAAKGMLISIPHSCVFISVTRFGPQLVSMVVLWGSFVLGSLHVGVYAACA